MYIMVRTLTPTKLLFLIFGISALVYFSFFAANASFEFARTTDTLVSNTLDDGLVGHWTFDGPDVDWSATTAEIKDVVSTNEGNALNLAAANVTSGALGQAVLFDKGISGQAVSVGSAAALDDLTQRTVVMWIRPTGTQSVGTLFTKDFSSPLLSMSGGSLMVRASFSTMDGWWISEVSPQNDVWQQVAVTYDRSSTTNDPVMYINGESVMVSEVLGPSGSYVSNAANTAHIGGWLGTSVTFNGGIDDVRVYNRILSPDEIAQLYAMGEGVKVATTIVSAASTLDDGLVGHWTFDGVDISGTTAYDLTSSYATGTLTSGAAVAGGAIGQGIALDGSDDFVTVADTAALDFGASADFTLSGWFRRESYTTDDTLIAKRNGLANTDDGYIAYIDDADDKFYFEVSENSGTDEYSLVSTRTFTDNDWHHFMVTWDDDNANNTNLFIDGTYETTVKTGTIGNIGDLSTALAFRIGAESDGDNPFAGKVDDVKVYNRALSTAEVYRTYSSGSAYLRTCGSVTDADGNLYSTLVIGTQCWLAQNMRVGTRISASTAQTNNATIEKWCYSNSDANCTSNNPNEPDGGLYQWNEAMQYSSTQGAQGICPAGWHIPTHDEFTTLERALCTSSTCATDFPYDTTTAGYRGTTEGTKLKPNGTAGLNFNLAGLGFSGSFSNRGTYGYVWSSSESGAFAWSRYVLSGTAQVVRYAYGKSNGLSVRCVKD
ncbi:MAG: hypothetical protein H6780_03095 [Candidatus Nomurabacteria bacterium]|nr:MAG: hypothetical protein H6780_03095 [Candidatus Nomurabacteria bacterium]